MLVNVIFRFRGPKKRLNVSAANLRGALTLLDAVLDRQPRCAAAWAARAHLRTLFPLFDLPMDDARNRAEQEARRALAYDPSLLRAHRALAFVLLARFEWLEALTHFEAAGRLEATPDVSLTTGLLWQSVGHLERDRRQAEEISRTWPHIPLVCLARAGSALFGGIDDEAERFTQQAASLGWPLSQRPVPDLRFTIALRRNQFAAAAQAAKDGLDDAFRHAGAERVIDLLCETLRSKHERARTLLALRALVKRTRGSALGQRTEKTVLSWFVLLGGLDDAFEFLAAILDHDRMGGPNAGPWGFLWGPEMRPLRRDPRFKRIVDTMNFSSFWNVLWTAGRICAYDVRQDYRGCRGARRTLSFAGGLIVRAGSAAARRSTMSTDPPEPCDRTLRSPQSGSAER